MFHRQMLNLALGRNKCRAIKDLVKAKRSPCSTYCKTCPSRTGLRCREVLNAQCGVEKINRFTAMCWRENLTVQCRVEETKGFSDQCFFLSRIGITSLY